MKCESFFWGIHKFENFVIHQTASNFSSFIINQTVVWLFVPQEKEGKGTAVFWKTIPQHTINDAEKKHISGHKVSC